jgi:biotin carboxylase
MRELLAQAGIPSPSFRRAAIHEDPEVIARNVTFPCVPKPSSLSGSRGVIRADDPAKFAAAFTRVVAILRRPEVAAQAGQLAE